MWSDKLVETGIVDEEKVGLMGWSNGGYRSIDCTYRINA
ncbi:TPA: prolyl oligopeptidase family serine peptidase [Yersinia enterocolitica]|nr:prolyl oligopeptidase family serine peptidase [Yersinia enterocolitica]